jgi:aminoglycoside phosphotransferase (APT) family kinase protein
MNTEFEIIKTKLQEEGVLIDEQTLQKNVDQGFMSTVYMVESDQGELVIHIIKPASEWVRQRIWEKLRGVGDILKNYSDLPVSPVFLSGEIEDKYFLVQKKLSGKPAGKRGISTTEVVDNWNDDASQFFVPQIQRLLAVVHSLPCEGYGMPVLQNGKLQGSYDSWEEFFNEELPRWLKSIDQGDANSNNPEIGMASRKAAAMYVQDFLTRIPPTQPSIVHGDAINPSNILTDGKKITGLIDWEWSLFGDPAWEFCDPGWWPFITKESLQPYFIEAKKHAALDEDEFLRRVHLYIPLWMMWGCQLHSENPNGPIYQVLRLMLANLLSVEY